MKNIRFARKLPVIIATLSAFFVLIFGTTLYYSSKSAILSAQYQKLAALNEAKAQHLRYYLNSFENDLLQVAANPRTHEALRRLRSAWRSMKTPGDELPRIFVEDSSTPQSDRVSIDNPNRRILYSKIHAIFHPWFRSFMENKGFYDVFLIDMDGNVIYSVKKEDDFATNLITGAWKDTDLSRAFRRARDSGHPTDTHYLDFQTYEPSTSQLASFLSVPVFDDEQQKIGVLILQIPITRLNQIMSVGSELGNSGDSYLVDSKGALRSRPRLLEQESFLSVTMPPAAMSHLNQMKSGVLYTNDYRNVPVVSGYSTVSFRGQNYIVMTDLDQSEVLTPINALRSHLIISALLVFATMALAGANLAKMVTLPLSRITSSLSELSAGNTNIEIHDRGRRDEIGRIAEAAHQFRDTLIENTRMSDALMRSKKDLEDQVRERTQNLQQANEELEEFAYRTSHDLRSPLVSSIALLRTVEDDLAEGELEDVPECVSLALNSIEKLETLVQDILSLTQIKHFEEADEDVDITDLVDQSINKFSHMENFERVEIRQDLTEAKLPKLKRSRLQLIVENLISNAIKYQDTAKPNPFIEIVSSFTKDGFTFSVKDNGIGVPEEQRDKMFVMFKRFHPDVSFGSGLGLYMMKKSAKILGGELLYDDPGEGSLFTLHIPNGSPAGTPAE